MSRFTCTARSRDRNRAHLPTSSYAKASRQPERALRRSRSAYQGVDGDGPALDSRCMALGFVAAGVIAALGSATGTIRSAHPTLELISAAVVQAIDVGIRVNMTRVPGVLAIRRRFGRVLRSRVRAGLSVVICQTRYPGCWREVHGSATASAKLISTR